MKDLILWAALFLMVAVVSLLPRTDGIASEFPPMPTLASLGLGMSGMGSDEPLVGDCECHSPFMDAGIRGGDLILSVDGNQVRTNDDVSELLSQARPDTSIEFEVISSGFQTSKTIIVEFRPEWWLLEPKKNKP